jgi:hypothetical protein
MTPPQLREDNLSALTPLFAMSVTEQKGETGQEAKADGRQI